MTPHATPRMATLSIIAVYWLMLVLGMATCIAMRCDAPIAAIWTGAVAGTVLGHTLALLNVRSWFAIVTVLTIAAIVGPSAPGELSASTLWLAFIPAAACAFWSLGDRTTLLAFWFPAVIWMLSILDHASTSGVPDDAGIALLGVLVLLFLLFLRVRESRRVALWRTVAPQPTMLAHVGAAKLLRERPGFTIARAGWAGLASALAFAGTVWLAPRLWGSEQLAGAHMQVASQKSTLGAPCCPVADAEESRHRVKEYFAIGRGHADQLGDQDTQSCRRCEGGGVTEQTAAVEERYIATEPASSVAHGAPTWGREAPAPQMPWAPPAATAAKTPAAPPVTPIPPPVTPTPPPVTPTPPPVKTPSPPATVAATTPEPAAVAVPQDEPAPAAASSASSESAARPAPPLIGRSMLEWLAVLLGAALVIQLAALAVRPLRRVIALRHLRVPFWRETVDQRVSNAWQLALVGLRDAGWRPDSDESPRELARRVGVDGVERCAAILERARHGIGIDAEDLSTMAESAQTAYRDARSRLRPVARAMTWLRWPLT